MLKVVTILLVFITHFSFSQDETLERHDSTLLASKLDSLMEKHGYNKTLLEEYKVSFLAALTHYPELDSTSIKLKEAKINTSLNARPTILSLLLRSKTKRKYVIRINTKEKDSLILLEDAPFNAQVGVFGHELGHLSDYNSRSFFGIVKRLISYSKKSSKTEFEKEIDTLAIRRGLGWHLYDWAYYVLESSNGTEKYKAFKRDVYLEPEEILEWLD